MTRPQTDLPLMAWAAARALDPQADEVRDVFVTAFRTNIADLQTAPDHVRWALIDAAIARELARLRDADELARQYADRYILGPLARMDAEHEDIYLSIKTLIANAGFWTGFGLAAAVLLRSIDQ